MLEAKGDYLDGDDSKTKLKLGRRWQSAAGNKYRYFMVFDKKALPQEGAYTRITLVLPAAPDHSKDIFKRKE